MKNIVLLLLAQVCFNLSHAQTNITIYLDSIQSAIGAGYEQGVFYVPKTNEAQADFLSNDVHQNSIRLNIIEGALNNTTNLNDCILYLDNVSSILQSLANKTDKVIFIFEKMPAWLSSSSDGSIAQTPGWYVLNTKPPANYSDWNTMVATVVDRIVNNYGISNAYFEIWNEPDLGSWTGTKAEYFTLFKNSYDAIKSVNANIFVGGPATNHWGKNINYLPPYGYLTNYYADLSLIGELIDSSVVWNKPLDFLSWHNFDVVHQSNKNAVDYITQKYTNLGLSVPQLLVSEWNTPSSVRDTPLQKSFLIKNQIEMAKTTIDYNMVAAWQDFDQSANEFHNDYGLVTYGGIHKSAYNALLLSDKIDGVSVKNISNAPTNVVTSVLNGKLKVLITNYVPPAFIGAFNHTLFEGHINANQIDSMGYINITTNDLSQLEQIYQGIITIPNTNSINISINNSIAVYNHFDSLQTNNRQINFSVDGISGVDLGLRYTINSIVNNFQFKYDSLLTQGFTQQNAITFITNNQNLVSSSVSLNNGQLSFSMEPNSVNYFEFVIPEISSVNEDLKEITVSVYPNPTQGNVIIKHNKPLGGIDILNVNGKVIQSLYSNSYEILIDLSLYAKGFYFIKLIDLNETVKIIRK